MKFARFVCSHCGRSLVFPARATLDSVRCPSCGTQVALLSDAADAPVVVTSADETSVDETSPEPLTPEIEAPEPTTPPTAREEVAQHNHREPLLGDPAESTNPDQAAHTLVELALGMQPLSDEEIQWHLFNWSGDPNLKPFYGSSEQLAGKMLPLFQSYAAEAGFQKFTIAVENQWKCARARLVSDDQDGEVLLWRTPDGLAAMAKVEVDPRPSGSAVPPWSA